MVTAIVMINAQREQIAETAAAIAAVRHVKEVYSVTGEWDIVAILRLPGYEHLDDVVTGHLRRIPGIARTQTMLAFRTYDSDQLERGFTLGLDESSSSGDGSV
ncbi:DNA-binding Lrp family transcriptional regulator [Deinobacterium chartae]|uniref:DNA-binding Lrp family transcriptional regulator n=1 Tax=Deinobacterium chartae TaxID=521158 RepID=A0A841HYN8_9DEIO|nr:Lrp/AsnC ligand binding domain-containing protein [Deinobacterium chartae]MBB6098661.1 DNA-binding Lrp family transcriptional regulator [Deinobacterium chartae]